MATNARSLLVHRAVVPVLSLSLAALVAVPAFADGRGVGHGSAGHDTKHEAPAGDHRDAGTDSAVVILATGSPTPVPAAQKPPKADEQEHGQGRGHEKAEHRQGRKEQESDQQEVEAETEHEEADEPRNHGAAVRAAVLEAQELEGRERGELVSAVAHSDAGKAGAAEHAEHEDAEAGHDADEPEAPAGGTNTSGSATPTASPTPSGPTAGAASTGTATPTATGTATATAITTR